MSILEAHLRNFCQFQDQQVSLSPRMTAFMGPNGAGKSNLVNAFYTLLTGDFSRYPGKKEDSICQQAGPDEASYLHGKFEFKGKQVEIYRGLRKTQSRLIIDGKKECSKEGEITAYVLEKLLGVTQQILSEHVFIEQGKLDQFLSATPAIREAAFQQLLGLDHAETCYQGLGDVLSTLEIPSYAGALQSQRNTLAGVLEGLQQKQEALAARAFNAEGLAAREQQLVAELAVVQKRDQLLYQLGRVDGELERHQQHHARLMAGPENPETVAAGLAVLQQNLAEAAADYQTAQLCLAEIQGQAEVQGKWHAFEAAKAKFLQGFRQFDRRRPVKPANWLSPEAREAAVQSEAQLAAEEKQLKADLAWYSQGNCPTCKRPLEVPVSLVDLERKLHGLQEQRRQLSADIHATDVYLRAVMLRLSQLQGWQMQVRSLRDTRRALPKQTSTPGDAAVWASVVQAYQVLQQRVTAEASRLAVLSQTRQTLEAEISHQMEERAPTAYELSLLPQTTATKQQLEAELAQVRARRSEEHGLQMQLAQAEQLAATLRANVAELEAKEQQAQELAVLRERLLRCRGVFHRERLPRRVLQRRFGELERRTNDALAAFDVPFRLVTGSGTDLILRFANGTQSPARRLSGGQRAILSLTMRVAINSMFASSLGLLCLDEPTAHVDKQNRRMLDKVLHSLRAAAAASGLQCILVTHDEELQPLFDQVVLLPGVGL